MTSESMVKPSIYDNALKLSKPSPRSQDMLKDYCRGTFIGESDQEQGYGDDDDGILNETKVVTADGIDVMGYMREYMRRQRRANRDLLNGKLASKTTKSSPRSRSRSGSEGTSSSRNSTYS